MEEAKPVVSPSPPFDPNKACSPGKKHVILVIASRRHDESEGICFLIFSVSWTALQTDWPGHMSSNPLRVAFVDSHPDLRNAVVPVLSRVREYNDPHMDICRSLSRFLIQ